MLRLPQWRKRAACADRPDLDFIDPGDHVPECLALCATCPVARLCLTEALDNGEVWGIWGGLDTDQREQLAHELGRPAPAIKPGHGTHRRYAKHGCRCDLCREAHNTYNRRRRQRRRTAA
ncbi:WhiB family transcriptional regulator [Actinokineospora bangkokensis]|uniref:WhiB family transcriptional regulator n=1 Tax=Actinokineospora bangkokensis TaxID=1193682 RepID=UPI00096B4711